MRYNKAKAKILVDDLIYTLYDITFVIVSIHQANYLPYPGFFHKITLANVFVVMDDVQYQFDHTNRNKIVANNAEGWTRIIIPTKKQHKFSPIMNV